MSLRKKVGEPFSGVLRCETCGRVESPGPSWRNWPTCHGYTMRWWTQRQIDAGEVPTVGTVAP